MWQGLSNFVVRENKYFWINNQAVHDCNGYSKLNKWNTLKQTSIACTIEKTSYYIESKKKQEFLLGQLAYQLII